MSEIDVQNSRQIRDPMDVRITMSLANADISMTYSGYSMAKVADGKLDKTDWPMRKLADLQGDGFPLDGSCVLYNASTTPSQVNGKLGVRGNVGETVTVTATGDRTMASIGASVTGAESVTMNGTTTPITGTNVTLPLLDTTATLTFNPASETRRIEINTVLPEADFKITNENLIRATVSLRSDLSIINQTLPESEINIEVYQDTDISEAVASIPEDTPIMYSAGYEGDMSPVRRFYVTGQVTWADNVLTIQGVDGVHFLDKELKFDLALSSGGRDVTLLTEYILDTAGVSAEESLGGPGGRMNPIFLIKRGTALRDTMAALTWLYSGPDLFFQYVDAGRPSVLFRGFRPGTSFSINEEDCGDIRRNIDRAIGRVRVFGQDVERVDNVIVGKFDWTKNGAAYVTLDDYTISFGFYSDLYYGYTLLPRYKPDGIRNNIVFIPDRSGRTGLNKLYSSDVSEDEMAGLGQGDTGWVEAYCQVVPWSSRAAAGWANMVKIGDIDPSQNSVTLDVGGDKYTQTDFIHEETGAAGGETVEISPQVFAGRIRASVGSPPKHFEVFPDLLVKNILTASLITGSFTWKGDPRMQPRDVVEWERLDGTTTTITLENITLTHQGGGTSAEITYREGVV